MKIEGIVSHEWRDDYDWHKNALVWIPGEGIIPVSEGQLLQDNGRGSPFKLRSKWLQRVSGTVEIRNGTTANPRIEWRDINQ